MSTYADLRIVRTIGGEYEVTNGVHDVVYKGTKAECEAYIEKTKNRVKRVKII